MSATLSAIVAMSPLSATSARSCSISARVSSAAPQTAHVALIASMPPARHSSRISRLQLLIWSPSMIGAASATPP
jgi:hypothetical protein